jgi:hypothetical protein
MFLGPYVPDKILKAVAVYIHRRNLHPSTTQTIKEFKAYNYHPIADRVIKEICRNCITCTQTRNREKRNVGVGRQRTLKPTKPREGISMDIIYLPKSKGGYTHGLLIGDLFSLYVSFYPMKSKTSQEVAKKLNLYISSHGIPKSIYSDSDPSFRGETEKLIRTYNIQHVTSYPYTQKENQVESQVRTFKNAYRAAIAESEIFKREHWDKLFPIVICRINSLISKYGMSREAMHFGNIVESSLPLITDTEIFSPLEEDLEETAKRFRDKMGRFMAKREKNKQYYKIGKKYKFYMYELVMKAEYTTESALHPTHTGPHRIINLSEKGAEIKDIKTGEISNVNFENIRKISIDELLALLPTDFDDEINKSLGTFRYNRKQNNDQSLDHEAEEMEEIEKEERKTLRSGRCYQINITNPPERVGKLSKEGIWRSILIKKHTINCNEKPKSNLKLMNVDNHFLHTTMKQRWDGDNWMSESHINTLRIGRGVEWHDYAKRRKKSRFASYDKGTLIILIEDKEENYHKTVRFKEIKILFY